MLYFLWYLILVLPQRLDPRDLKASLGEKSNMDMGVLHFTYINRFFTSIYKLIHRNIYAQYLKALKFISNKHYKISI
jgi:hypothetical protein